MAVDKDGNEIPENKEEKVVSVPLSTLTKMQEQMAELERKDAEKEAKMAGLEAMLEAGAKDSGEQKLNKKKTFDPKFRTVRIRKYPIAGDFENKGYVIGWTNRGAYQSVDRSGISPTIVDMVDVIFLGREKNKDGKLQAEQVKLLDLMNKGEQIHCKILDEKKEYREEPTGEEIDCTTWDPVHGLVSTGEKVDGYTAFTDYTYKIQIPGVEEPVWIDAMFCN